MKTLTMRQTEILLFIESFKSDKGFSPSIRDISKEFNDISTSAVFNHLESIERKGFISRDRKTARSITIEKPFLIIKRTR